MNPVECRYDASHNLWSVLVHGVEVWTGYNEVYARIATVTAENTVERLALLELMGVGPTDYRHEVDAA